MRVSWEDRLELRPYFEAFSWTSSSFTPQLMIQLVGVEVFERRDRRMSFACFYSIGRHADLSVERMDAWIDVRFPQAAIELGLN